MAELDTGFTGLRHTRSVEARFIRKGPEMMRIINKTAYESHMSLFHHVDPDAMQRGVTSGGCGAEACSASGLEGSDDRDGNGGGGCGRRIFMSSV